MRDEHGFMLLEVLVSAAIAAMAFAVLLPAAVGGVATVRGAGAEQTAIALARSHLALLGANMADTAPDTHGSDGPFNWRVRITPQATPPRDAGMVEWFRHKDEPRTTLYAVTVNVSWQADGRHHDLAVQTQRLGFALPPPPEIQ